MEAVWIGLGLGLAAGFSPGPLLTLVLSATLQRGAAAGLRVAAAPLVTDLPVVVVALLLAGQSPPEGLYVLSLVGGLFVIYLGWGTWKDSLNARLNPAREGQSKVLGQDGEAAQRHEADSAGQESPPKDPKRQDQLRKDLWGGALVNILSPHPWLFWIGIGGPQTIGLYRQEGWLPSAAFLTLFYVGLVGSKALLAVSVAGGRHRLSDLWYRHILKGCAWVLALLGLWLCIDGALRLWPSSVP